MDLFCGNYFDMVMIIFNIKLLLVNIVWNWLYLKINVNEVIYFFVFILLVIFMKLYYGNSILILLRFIVWMMEILMYGVFVIYLVLFME